MLLIDSKRPSGVYIQALYRRSEHNDLQTVLINTRYFPSGVEFQDVPDTGDVPLVADMSSNILTRPVDVGKVRTPSAVTR